MYSVTLKTAFILLATGYVASVSAQNILNDDFADTPESVKTALKSATSSKCGTSITKSCACSDGLYILNVAALLQQPNSGCSDSEKKSVFQEFFVKCATLTPVTV